MFSSIAYYAVRIYFCCLSWLCMLMIIFMVLRISYMHQLMKLTIKFIGNVICYLSVICDVYQKPNKYTRMCVQISLHFGRVLDVQSMNNRRRAIYVCVFSDPNLCDLYIIVLSLSSICVLVIISLLNVHCWMEVFWRE